MTRTTLDTYRILGETMVKSGTLPKSEVQEATAILKKHFNANAAKKTKKVLQPA